MENNRTEMHEEEQQLQSTLVIAKEQLDQAQKALREKEQDIIEAKRQVRENTTHGVTNLYHSDDFEAIVELSQCMNPVEESISDYEEEERRIRRLEKIIERPYFARIDFRFEEDPQAEHIYIGRSSLTEKKAREIYVYDWRSPIAGVFYRCALGKAFYEAPGGIVEGELQRKRQYEIADSVLKFYFDADMTINDEFLRLLLSKNTSPQMKAIVETIQKEQDIVIRNMESDLLMVQGVAGSGKTSIALHRAAYLMYQGLQAKLSANSILILSPNSVFEEYISNVLPELGEENVNSVIFDDILCKILQGYRIQTRNDFWEHMMEDEPYSSIARKSMDFKMSESFRNMLDAFLLEIPLRWIDFHDIHYNGSLIISKEQLREWVLRRPHISLGTRLSQLEDYVIELIFGTGRKHGDGEQRNLIRQEIREFTQLNIIELYGKIFRKSSVTENDIPDNIRKYTQENLSSGLLFYDDATAAAYLYLKTYGNTGYRHIRQVVIDEAQDYYSLQYEIFRLLFTNAKFTVLGDINQTLVKPEKISLYETIRQILNKEKSDLIILEKSFRCTNEILNFSLRFIDDAPQIKSFNRTGESPQVLTSGSYEELLKLTIQEIAVCREKGLESICLICKTAKLSDRLYEDLKQKTEIRQVKNGNAEGLKGTFVMPVYMSKGLEFDGVIVCDADMGTHCSEEDKKLLYVECTRALHRLSLICSSPSSSSTPMS
jgi:DNA helicase-2/ATP-dependent DNA helicase PcrA